MSHPITYIGLDVGGRRIGVARGNSLARLATPLTTVSVDGSEIEQIKKIVDQEKAGGIVVGLPRGLDAQETQQTQLVRQFTERLKTLGLSIDWQDEAATTKQAEAESHKSVPGIDAHAAAIILQDFLDNLS